MIPNIIHIIFGLDENTIDPDWEYGKPGRPFSLIHYLCMKAAIEVNNPDKLMVHYCYEPQSDWWEKAKLLPKIEFNKVPMPLDLNGNPIKVYAIRADLLRLRTLLQYGGIYIDSDVLCMKPFTPLLNNQFVMGEQHQRGLCNAVILSQPEAEFAKIWLSHFYTENIKCREVHDEHWDYLAVLLPFEISKQRPDLIQIENYKAFHWPLWTWHGNDNDLFKYHPTDAFPNAYCHHLWESMHWEHLYDLTIDRIKIYDTYLNKQLRKFI